MHSHTGHADSDGNNAKYFSLIVRTSVPNIFTRVFTDRIREREKKIRVKISVKNALGINIFHKLFRTVIA